MLLAKLSSGWSHVAGGRQYRTVPDMHLHTVGVRWGACSTHTPQRAVRFFGSGCYDGGCSPQPLSAEGADSAVRPPSPSGETLPWLRPCRAAQVVRIRLGRPRAAIQPSSTARKRRAGPINPHAGDSGASPQDVRADASRPGCVGAILQGHRHAGPHRGPASQPVQCSEIPPTPVKSESRANTSPHRPVPMRALARAAWTGDAGAEAKTSQGSVTSCSRRFRGRRSPSSEERRIRQGVLHA
jgi:hypothetical protein